MAVSKISTSSVFKQVGCVIYVRQNYRYFWSVFHRYFHLYDIMSHIDDSGDLDDDNLLSYDPLYADISDNGEDKHEVVMAAVPATSKADISMSSADVNLLSSTILNITKRLDKLEENPSC